MKMFLRVNCFTLFFLAFNLLIKNSALAHQDFYVFKTFGNVKTRIKTGFNYDEINKVAIIGQLGEQLSKKLNYKKDIFLDFHHSYTDNIEPDYFISFDKGLNQESDNNYRIKPLLKKNGIVIRQVGKYFDPVISLKLIEYAITNVSSIQENQRQINYQKWYISLKINTIDTTVINQVIRSPASESLNEISQLKVYRQDLFDTYLDEYINYYWQDGKYKIITKEFKEPETLVFELSRVVDFQRQGNYSAFIFDTDSTFYYIARLPKVKVSHKHIIQDAGKTFRPIKITSLSNNKISLFFSYFDRSKKVNPIERLLIYDSTRDLLIQSLDKLIDQKD